MVAGAQDKLYQDEFPLGDVTLLDGPLKKARDLNIKTLLHLICSNVALSKFVHTFLFNFRFSIFVAQTNFKILNSSNIIVIA